MPRKRSPRWVWLGLTILIAVTLAVPISYLLMPHAQRWQSLDHLTDADFAKREIALSYLIHHANKDDLVLQGAIEKLAVPNQANFLQIVAALDRGGCWKRPLIPDQSWLRWLHILANDDSTDARVIAIQIIADQADLADDHRLHELLAHRLADDIPLVRYNTLAAAAELAGCAKDTGPYEQLIQIATQDSASKIARHAWMILGLINPASGITANWQDLPPPVAQAILWANLYTHPDNPTAAIQALNDPLVDLATRQLAAYALTLSHMPKARDALIGLIPQTPLDVTPENVVLAWRAILGIRFNPADATDPAAQAIRRFLSVSTYRQLDDPILEPLTLAAVLRIPRLGRVNLQKRLGSNIEPLFKSPLLPLAVMEGQPTSRFAIAIPDTMPPALRLGAVAGMTDPQPDDLRPLFTAPGFVMRDLACIVAADRFSDDDNRTLISSLLNDFNDHAKRSGATLAGLTGLHPQLLAKKARDEDIWSVRQIMYLGMWMQGKTPIENGTEIDMDQLAPGLLTRTDLPTTTILLAMLHRKHPQALDYLFNPRGEERLDLIELFDQFRWWRVISRYLPDDAPPFWPWADAELEQFQIDLMRDWYLLNRHRLAAGQP